MYQTTLSDYVSIYQHSILQAIKTFDQTKASQLEYFKSIQNSPYNFTLQEFLQTLHLKQARNKELEEKIHITTKGQSGSTIYSSKYLDSLKLSALKERKEFVWLDDFPDEREFFYAITYLPFMETLEILHLNFISVGSKLYLSLFSKALKFLQNLKHLVLPGCEIGSGAEFSTEVDEQSEVLKEFSEALCYLPNLLTLDLSYNRITLDRFVDIVNINNNSDSLCCFQIMSNLSKLDFSFGKMERCDSTVTVNREKKNFMLCQIELVRRLQELHLCNQDLYGSMDTLAGSVMKLRLKILGLSGNGLRAGDVEKLLEPLNNYFSLQELYLNDNEIGDQGVQLILSSLYSKLPQLRLLDVEKNNISTLDYQQVNIESLKVFFELKVLNISKNLLADHFEKTLSVILRCFTRLERLYISDCELKDENFIYFITVIDIGKCCNLYCDLQENKFTGKLIETIEAEKEKINKFTKLLLKPKNKNSLLSFLKHSGFSSIFPI